MKPLNDENQLSNSRQNQRLVGQILQNADSTIQACDEIAEQLLGYTAEQLIGMTAFDSPWQTIHPDGTPFLAQDYPTVVACRTGTPCRDVVVGFYRPSGQLIWLQIDATPLFQPQQQSPYAVIVTLQEADNIAQNKTQNKFTVQSNQSAPSSDDPLEVFPGNSELAALMRTLDWSKTALGSVSSWSSSLKTAVGICLNSRFPMVIWWGKELTLLYNDAWKVIPGNRHPGSLGLPGEALFTESWHIVGPQLQSVMETGIATWADDLLIPVLRSGYLEEAYYTYSYSPIFTETGEVGGVFTAVAETTESVLSERRLAMLGDLAAQASSAKTVDQVFQSTIDTLSGNALDLPFAALYEWDADKPQARLRGQTPLIGANSFPAIVDLTSPASDEWSFASVVQTHQACLNDAHRRKQRCIQTSNLTGTYALRGGESTLDKIENLTERFIEVPTGALSLPVQQALVLPIRFANQESIAGLLIAGINPARAFDADYRAFFTMVAGHIATAIANTQAYEEERKRAEALAELDRAKTTFFSNVSHEFRTPLTLMLSPLEEVIADGTIPDQKREQLELVQRNGQRLLKLVNTLLDFSRIEAGRVQAVYEPINLAGFTAELASVFRSAIERAGMQLVVDCPPMPQAVYVDREMWEKIVLNLLSNAFKFTFTSGISVCLTWREDRVEFAVRDTGIGIPVLELPHLFERFHRVKGAQGRSIEGSGIGLSLVQELVKLHGGTIAVTSVEGSGTCFTVSIPTGTVHLPPERISAARTLASTASDVNAYLEEALRWLPESNQEVTPLREGDRSSHPQQSPNPFAAKILLVDDNADMRDYVQRLLSQQYKVRAVSDGLAALSAVREQIPDLVLSDVMMPNLDGFGLLQALRGDPETREIPIILLSARAGEEARIEGLEAGADDYLIKPFSARELLARVEATLKLTQVRQAAAQQEQTLRREAETAKHQVETILSSIRDGFYVLDRDWRFTYVNDRYCEMVGMQPAEILGQNVWKLFPAAVDTEAYVQFHQAMTDQKPHQFDYLYAPWNCWHDHRIYPFPNGLTVFLTEITDRKQAEAERERLLQQTEAARKQAEDANRIKDEFLAVLSHELRSPLNPILGWAKLLQRGNLDAAKTATAIATIERNAKLQSELIEDLLDVSRILQGKLSLTVGSVDLAATVQSAIETVRLAAEAKSIQIVTNIDPEVGQVWGDATRLQQVVWNMLSNAVKFTPAGGRVEVRLEQVDRQAQITVSDNGKGIPVSFLPYTFDYFRQEDSATTRQFGGLGLGLAIVRHLVELHGGTVKAESPGEGLGATFTVKLPLLSTASQSVSPDRPNESELNLEGVKVLVVDDEADSREFVAFVLEQVGATVTTAASGGEGFLALAQSVPDVLVSDIGMPGMDGYALIRQVRILPPAMGGQVLAIALTAYAGDFNQKQALDAGFQRHLSKPIEPEGLVRTITMLIER